MSEELKLCPFCGSEVVLDRWTDADTDGTDIAMGEAVCTKCGCCGPAVPLEQAIAAWNQRAKPHLDVDQLANIIRAVDGDNTMGAGELAEAIVTSLEGYDHVED